MLENPMPPTTHTVEMQQLTELNARLASGPRGAAISAEDLGVAGATVTAGSGEGHSLAGSAILTRVAWDGPPEFPYIHGHFGDAVVELHTAALRELSHRLGLHHRWGV
jgi:hypothetical protein